LIDHGADVNASRALLLDAIGAGRPLSKNFTAVKAAAMTELLMSRGATMNRGRRDHARRRGWLRACHAAGALTDPPGPYGLVARAVISGRADMLTLLLDLGCDPDERRRLGDLDDIVYSWGEPLRTCAIAGRADLLKSW
jgi:hypothetical protein